MVRQSASDAVFIALNYNITIIGKVWLVLMVFLRFLVLFFAGYPLYQDEQERFVCNTIQPGCANVCYDIFAPLSPFRFWLIQLTSIFLPYILFVVYVMHKVSSSLQVRPETAERLKIGSLYQIHQESFRQAALSKSTVKSEGRRQRFFTGAYILHLLLRILLEVGFGAGHYYLFGFHVPKRFLCHQAPCTIVVDCYVSRPTEKTILLNFMLGAAGLSMFFTVLDLICTAKRSVRHKRKRKMLVEKMYEEEQYFVTGCGNGEPDCGIPDARNLLVGETFGKRIGPDDRALLHLQGDTRPSSHCEEIPKVLTSGTPGSMNDSEGMEQEGSEVALCPPEPPGSPRSIRVRKQSRLKPPPPPRLDRKGSVGSLDASRPKTVCTQRVGHYTLVEMSGGTDLPNMVNDGQEKRSEWV